MKKLAAACAAVLLLHLPAGASVTVSHRLTVEINPDGSTFSAVDLVTFPEGYPRGPNGVIFLTLHGGLNPLPLSSPDDFTLIKTESDPIGTETWRVVTRPGGSVVSLRYGGKISHPLMQVGEEYARGQKETLGSTSPDGVFLTGSSGWYPRFEGNVTFSLEIILPGGWDAVSQGERVSHVRQRDFTRVTWATSDPQGEICLAAGKYTEYAGGNGPVRAMVFLRTPDETLAGKYLQATERYIRMYGELIGPYAYRKFALVENFWETGYGMPSFTLLGPQVIRFPFIINSSYPHEILHSWWGNSVWVDASQGNWSEGLTAYLSDHLMKEQAGSGAEHRQVSLQRYTDYVLKERDLPLGKFGSREGSVTEAVGYGKSLMLFHMLRLKVGDEAFIKSLRELYAEFKFKAAGFEDLRRAFERSAGIDLRPFFRQWVERTGAPSLRVKDAEVPATAGFGLDFTLEQVQEGEPFLLDIPVAVTVEGQANAVRVVVELKGRETRVTVGDLPGRPLRLDVDPEFDVFRKLDRNETPPALSQAFGSEKALIVLPSAAAGEIRDGWRKLAEFLAGAGPGETKVADDAELSGLPTDRSVWLLGWDNRFLPDVLPALEAQGFKPGPGKVVLGRVEVPLKDHAVVAAARHPAEPNLSLLFIGADNPSALPGLGRKLPHYHKYSYLAFEGEEPANVAKGRWPVIGSPLQVALAPSGGPPPDMGKLESRRPLISAAPVFSRERMMETVRTLTGPALRGRGLGSKELEKAMEYVRGRFAAAGLQPAGDTPATSLQLWTADAGEPKRRMMLQNVAAAIPGVNEKYAGQSVVIGAHLDGLGTVGAPGREQLFPGADDNASGVAVLLELADVLGREMRPERTVVFAVFTGEEAGKLGSRHYLEAQKTYPAPKIMGMIDLDTVGRLGGRKLLALGADSAREWVHVLRGAGYVAGVEIETVKENLDSSDQTSFAAAGIPAIQLFSGPHADYHRPSDTADKIDLDGMVKTAAAAREIVQYLAGRPEALTSRGTPGANAAAPPAGERKVSLGTMPDFAWSGEGMRLSGVMAGSAAERAGLKDGDVILSVNGTAVAGIRGFSEILKALKPGDKVSVVYSRDGRRFTVEAAVEAR